MEINIDAIIRLIEASLYFAAPGLIANTAPIFVKGHFNFLAKPIDFGIKLRNRPLFGKNKTIRGYAFAILAAIAVAYLQKWLFNFSFFRNISYIDYSSSNAAYIGILLGFGALFGDSIESMIKRQLDIKPGAKFFPWDQLDYAVGIIAFSSFIKPYTAAMAITLLIFGPLLSFLTTRAGYYLGLRKEKW